MMTAALPKSLLPALAALPLVLPIPLASCASGTSAGTTHDQPLPENTEVTVFRHESEVGRPFKVQGIVSYTNPGKYRVMTLGDAMDDLKDRARKLGGNGLIIDEWHTVKSGIISTGIAVSARAIRLESPPVPTISGAEFRERTQRLDLGMTTDDVENLLGKPSEVSLEQFGYRTAEPWSARVYWYRVEGRRFRVIFERSGSVWTLHSFEWFERMP
jgi:hypothetical protein